MEGARVGMWHMLALPKPTVGTTVVVKYYMCVCVPPTKAGGLIGLIRFITIVRWLGLAHDGDKPCKLVFYGRFRSPARVR